MHASKIFALGITAASLFGCWQPVVADIFVTGFFTGNIERFDEDTKAQSIFATIPGNPGLSGIAYNPTNHRVYVSALNLGGVYILDASDGSVLSFEVLGFGPGGLAVSAAGEVYVTDFTSNLVRFYDSSMAELGSISIPAATVTSGVGFLDNGDVIISTAFGGVFRFDGDSVTAFTTDPAAALASSQVAADDSGNVFVGHGLGSSDNVFRFATDGMLTGVITVTDAMLDGTGTGSTPGTSPSGVAIDSEGNVIVAALGRSNPGDEGGERGGLLKFDADGDLLDTFISGSSAYSSVAIFNPVLEAEVVNAFVYHNSWTGQGDATDLETVVHREGDQPETLSLDNLINSAAGLNGLAIDVMNLAAPESLGETDFEIRVSPQGAFDLESNPPSEWEPAPSPSSISVTEGAVDRILLIWSDNLIEDRWLKIMVKATENTGLAQPVTYYVGHLRGETTGAQDDVYSVSFQDIGLIRVAVGSTVGAGDKTDIDKSGTVAFSDISAMRSNVGAQLSNITVPVVSQ